ncbi:hypothetical protein SAMN02910298_01938 [Pseudobutyrivibrio sp. YE44]|uniref:DUF4176 domain-containing protein n=1 Tax=Pseudobutyrivibrio sp. YE44 TaxID=1520802 RepID=UPI000891C9D6|nr:DUF4176 domain-containing protein [Pseudobutyrivibrio sp. YE44]SDB39816.1 hypothetical protein SAMN02910298_01938 [Pseudobutyrivibrio sp. YE44]
MEIKELLPIGSVIWLRNAEHALMIFGVKQQNMDTGEEYDYIGVLYPEGNMGTESQFIFMHKDIEKVLFRGFEDENRSQFIDKLSEFYSNQEQ